jgi:hypothetical protein
MSGALPMHADKIEASRKDARPKRGVKDEGPVGALT